MKKERLDKLTAALESAGFEVKSMREEEYRHWTDGETGAIAAIEDNIERLGGATGNVLLEIRLIESWH
jgi:pyruvate-formate lyase-activating enzyme